MENITLESLIEEQKKRIPLLKYIPDPPHCFGFAYYCYEKADEYQKWLATASRFIGINFPNDKDVLEFEKISKKDITPNQQRKLLAILEAFSSLPTIIHSQTDKQGEITVNTNINNSNSQSQSQEQFTAVKIFLEAIKDDLTGKQIKEIKQVVIDNDNDLEKSKNGIMQKLKSFGSDVAANIIANILTNPAIWSGF